MKSTIFYLDRKGLGLAQLCWFKENKENEMMFGFCGLSFNQACFAYEYEDKYVSKEEMLSFRINYKEAKLRNKLLADHFIMHTDGSFHLKLNNNIEKYVHKVKCLTPIDTKIGEFLDFFIISDVVSKYEKIVEKRTPFVSINSQSNNFVILRGRFSGASFDLEKTVVEEESKTGTKDFRAILLDGKILKGIFTYQIMNSSNVNFSNRPKGTYVLIAFPTEIDKFLVKTFIFN